MSVQSDSDALEFMDERDDETSRADAEPWRILIVDDEIDIHRVTLMALTAFKYKDRPLEMVHAYSGADAREILSSSPAFSVILLDVVMETDNAGLLVANYIRHELNNNVVQIILRTGHPGSINEADAEKQYGCNYYEQKTNVTAQRLNSVMTQALSSYCVASDYDKNS